MRLNLRRLDSTVTYKNINQHENVQKNALQTTNVP